MLEDMLYIGNWELYVSNNILIQDFVLCSHSWCSSVLFHCKYAFYNK
jgi:hypothetical protein